MSFRGTEPKSLKNWIDDLEFATISPYETSCGKTCKLHSGFYKSYKSLKDQIIRAFDRLGVTSRTRIHTTGHSLGAAMATICAYDLRADGYNIIQSYTFGEPRVGNKAFSESFGNTVGSPTVYRLTHWRDPVRLP